MPSTPASSMRFSATISTLRHAPAASRSRRLIAPAGPLTLGGRAEEGLGQWHVLGVDEVRERRPHEPVGVVAEDVAHRFGLPAHQAVRPDDRHEVAAVADERAQAVLAAALHRPLALGEDLPAAQPFEAQRQEQDDEQPESEGADEEDPGATQRVRDGGALGVDRGVDPPLDAFDARREDRLLEAVGALQVAALRARHRLAAGVDELRGVATQGLLGGDRDAAFVECRGGPAQFDDGPRGAHDHVGGELLAGPALPAQRRELLRRPADAFEFHLAAAVAVGVQARALSDGHHEDDDERGGDERQPLRPRADAPAHPS
ncbi:hypothetical protein LRS13_11840 [Svornostia abyssi]|uniref:Uncharacterized protein n=1 Tax=Svornostia abyssi TaxID=2898438 RepID=A0ABY5PN68_9ACTN|nr:hypothetical protein LRS13_11840 [Parviterribacteraceae bacterium J379]